MSMRLRRAFGPILLTGILFPSLISAQATWRRTYGGFEVETAQSAAETADGSFLVTGTSGSFGNGASDIYVLLLNENGDPIWSRTYGTVGVEKGVSGRVLDDGFVFAGSTSLGEHGGYDMLLVRTDQNGEIIWQRNYGTQDWDLCNSMEVLSDGFLLGGISYGVGGGEGQVYLVRTDLNGDVLWSTNLNEGSGSECNAIAVASDNGFAIAGRIGTLSGFDDGYVARYNSDGTMIWDLSIGGDSTDLLTGLILTDMGSIKVNGVTSSESSVTQILTAGIDPSGVLEWVRALGNQADAGGTGIAQAHGSGYVITGYNTLNFGSPDMIFTLLDDQGYFLSGNNFGNGRPAWGNALLASSDGGYLIAGWSEDYGPGNRSCYVVKTDGSGQTASLTVETYFDPVRVPEIAPIPPAVLSPCPALAGSSIALGDNSRFTSYRLLNAQGQLVASGNLHGNSFNVPLDLSGAYVLELLDDVGDRFRFRTVIVGQ